MKPKEFDFLSAETLDEAVAALAEAGDDARILAGGQSLMAMLNLRLAEPAILIDISRIDQLGYIRADGNMIEIGATTTQNELKAWDGLAEKAPMLHKALPHIGHFQTRNRGTVCGSLAHADPSSELPLCLAALGGEVVLKSVRGERTLGAAEFQTGMLSTAKASDEMLIAARYPMAAAGAGYAFDEVAVRRGDFAVVSVAAIATDATIRLGIGGVADRPTLRDWAMLDGDALDEALNAFAWELGGYDDVHATAKYRRRLVRTVGRRVIEEAKSCRS
ncbi:MAG: FAD binding domain-containing protein [Alphaproteobacteria bacterium]